MMPNRDEAHEGIWRVAWCLSVRHLINNNTQAGWRLPAMCIIAYTHLIIGRFLALVHTRASERASERCRAFRSITNVFWDWERFTIGDSARSNSISQRNKLLEARIYAWMCVSAGDFRHVVYSVGTRTRPYAGAVTAAVKNRDKTRATHAVVRNERRSVTLIKPSYN